MGKAPSPPDPRETSAASTGTNVSTAIANAMMGNVSQITPQGSLTYEQTGSHSWTDPYTGQTYDIPTFTATQTLSPEMQAIQQQNVGAQTNLATLANEQSGFLRDYMRGGMDESGLPRLVGSVGLQRGLGDGFDERFQQGLGPDYSTQFNGDLGQSFNQNFQQSVGGSFGDTLGPGYQTGVNLQQSYAGADDFSADRQRVEDALWQRGAGDRAQQEEALRTRLMNSGLREGSAAWNAEMERLARQNTDARLATTLAAGQEQSRLVGMARDAAGFGNDAALAQAGFGNQALGNKMLMQNQAALQGANFGQAAQQAQNAAAMTAGQFGSQQQQLGNQASMGLAQFGSQQQQAQNAAALASGQFGNQAAMQDATFQNAARAQGVQEMFARRSQPINEITALMSGSQVSSPNFVNTSMPSIPTTDNAGLINQDYSNRMSQWQQNQSVLGGLMGGLGVLLSDDDAKKDVRRRGEIDGMGVYEYRYKGAPGGSPKQIGLMASEVERQKPRAVRRRNGLRYVDYDAALRG